MRSLAAHLGCLALAWASLALPQPGRAGAPCPGIDAECFLTLARAELARLGTAGRQSDARDEVHFALATAEAARGALDAALAEVARIDDPVTRDEAQGKVAAEAARLGAHDRAEALALGIGGGRSLGARIAALQAVAVARARASGQPAAIDAAFRTLSAIANPYRRSEAEAHVALARAEAGDRAGAIAAAARIARGYWFRDTQTAQQVASGLVVRARDFDNFWLHEALTRIAEAEAEAADPEAALRIAQAIPDHEGRARAQGRIAAVLARQGRIDKARAIARGIDTPYGDRPALIAIVAAEAAAGDWAAAQALAEDLRQAYGDETALAAIARLRAASGAREQALAIARGIADAQLRAMALTDLAGHAAAAGDLTGAGDLIARLPTAPDRAAALARVAQDLARSGQAGAARRLLEGDPVGAKDPEIALALLLAQAEGGDWAGAQEAAAAMQGAMPGAMYSALAYGGLARLAAIAAPN